MNAGTLTKEQENGRIHDDEIVDFRSAETRQYSPRDEHLRKSGLFGFIQELRRRRVCRAVTMYCVAFWLVCQVVEIVSPPMGLPDWTLTFVIVQGMIGLPIALIASWLFEVTPNGLLLDRRRDHQLEIVDDAPRGRLNTAVDCGLLVVALIIGLQMALSATSTDSRASPLVAERIAVMPFPVTSAAQPDALSAALLIELQHELARQTSVTVVAPGDPSRMRDGSVLTGAVVVHGDHVRVTAIMIDNKSGEVTWSELLQFTYSDSATSAAAIAQCIVEALAVPIVSVSATGNDPCSIMSPEIG
jgi:TolB-like protein